VLIGLGVGDKSLAIAPAPQGMRSITGDVRINDRPALIGAKVNIGDRIESGEQSGAVFVMRRSAFLLRPHTQLKITPAHSWIRYFLRLTTGGLLAVFGQGETRVVHTNSATIGIRGTGIYLEAEPETTYLCTCYGTVDIQLRGKQHPRRETVYSQHHSGRIIQIADQKQPAIISAPMKGHQDTELAMLESLFERRPPFSAK